ncbi:MAG TPA: pitrilysin family protein [Gammaproteobacteria bacterium]
MLKKMIVTAAALLLTACAATPVQDDASIAAKETGPDLQRLAKGVTLPPYETVRLENGMQILLMEKHDVPMISFEVRVRGGAVADPADKVGVSALLADLLRRGAGNRDAVEFARTVESAGGVLETSSSKEAIVVAGEFMSRDAALMIELLGDMLMEPALARTEFDKLRERSIQQIAAMKDTSLRALTTVYGDAFLFGEHPYSRAVIGTEAGLANVTYPDVRRYFIEQFGADRAVLAVVGDFDTATMRARLEDRFNGWRRAAGTLPEIPEPAPATGNRVLLVNKPGATQTYFYIGNVGVERAYDQRAALDLVNTVFGGRFTSMLNTKLRVESGLTYGAGSRVTQYSEPGSLAIVSFTRTESTADAIDMALGVLERLHAGGLSPAQLASAKAYVLGQFPPELETAGGIAERLAAIAFYGLERDDVDRYAERVTAVAPEDARAVVETIYPERGELVFVLIGDAAAIRDAAARYGQVTEMHITDPRFRPAE